MTAQIPIQGSSTPEEHVTWVYDNLITRSSAEHVFLLGFAQGGALCKNIVERAIAVRRRHASDQTDASRGKKSLVTR